MTYDCYTCKGTGIDVGGDLCYICDGEGFTEEKSRYKWKRIKQDIDWVLYQDQENFRLEDLTLTTHIIIEAEDYEQLQGMLFHIIKTMDRITNSYE